MWVHPNRPPVTSIRIFEFNNRCVIKFFFFFLRKLLNNAKILKIVKYSKKPDSETNSMSTMSVVCAAMLCLLLSMIAFGLLYFGYVKWVHNVCGKPNFDAIILISMKLWFDWIRRSADHKNYGQIISTANHFTL